MGYRYNKIGIIGLGCMGLPMARNLAQKADIPVLGFDVMPKPLEIFEMAGGVPVRDVTEIYKDCDVIMQVLPTHETVIHSVEEAIRYGNAGKIIIDFSSTAPDIICGCGYFYWKNVFRSSDDLFDFCSCHCHRGSG